MILNVKYRVNEEYLKGQEKKGINLKIKDNLFHWLSIISPILVNLKSDELVAETLLLGRLETSPWAGASPAPTERSAKIFWRSREHIVTKYSPSDE